jgi:hypothetical protein
MSSIKSVSVIIDSYNYARFLPEAIDSALAQTYPHLEVIVVDDGSRDDSRDVIARYQSRVTAVLKDNGGQASALNAGFRASHGEIVCFLDSDDSLSATAVAQAVDLFVDPDVAKVHWPLWIVDADGRTTGKQMPQKELPEGDLRATVLQDGPWSYATPPTSGNAWSRTFLERVLPIPEEEYKTCPDSYLSTLVPLFGSVKRIDQPQGCYRVHGQNHHLATFDEKLSFDLKLYEQACAALTRCCGDLGIVVDPGAWKAASWTHRLHRAAQEVAALVPPGEAFILMDEDKWGTKQELAGRRAIPFLERDGQYWGPPADDTTAVRALERLRQEGATFLVVAWTAFWWLDHYAALHEYLRAKFRCILRNERLVLFDLR